jgi:ketosteroid isomerase-like protein
MPLTTEDRLDILDLYARQAWALDTGDVDAYVSLFTTDATLDLAQKYLGHAAIRHFAEDFRAHDVGLPGSQHHIDQVVLDGDGATCSARAYVTRTYRMRGRGRNNTLIIWQGFYSDRLAKQDGRWRIQEQVGRAWEGDLLDRVLQARQPVSV